MITWIAIVIAAFALVKIWQTHSIGKIKREFKQRRITERLRQIEERESKNKDSNNE